MLHDATMGDGMEGIGGSDSGQVEHIAYLKRSAALGCDLVGIEPGLHHDAWVHIDTGDLKAEGGGSQCMTSGAASQFQNPAAERHVAQQHVEENAVVGDPA